MIPEPKLPKKITSKSEAGIKKIPRVSSKTPKQTLGWREWVAIPELDVKSVKAKVDTGARSSSLHAEDVSYIEKKGKTWVQFVIGGGKRKGKLHRHSDEVCRAPLADERWITSSNGTRQRRAVIRVELNLNGQTWPVDLTLSSRESMGFPMLLGREAVRGRFVVDPARSYLAKEHLPAKRNARPKGA
jgi:hypothetical protein